jgi:hypothetical protein
VCHTNAITSIDFSTNINLTGLNCRNNNFTSLDLSSNSNFNRIDCSGNSNLTYINLKNGNNSAFDLASDFSNLPNLESVCVDDINSDVSNLIETHVSQPITISSVCSSLSVSQLNNDKNTFIFPNPTTGFVNIKSNVSEKIKSIEFYNALGQRIYNEHIYNISDIKIDISNLKKGLYFVKVNFENTKVISSKLRIN